MVAHWSIFNMAALKSSLDNSTNNSVIFVLASMDCLPPSPIQFEIFLVFGMTNDFWLKPGHFSTVLRLWILYKLVLPGFLWYHSSGGTWSGHKDSTLLLSGRGGSPTSHFTLLTPVRVVGAALIGLLWHHLRGVLGRLLIPSSWGRKVRILTAGVGENGPHLFLWYLEQGGYCLKIFYLLACPFPGPLPRESRLFGPFSVCTHCFWVFCVSSSPSGICEAKRKFRELTLIIVSFLKSWGPLAICLLFYTLSLLMFVFIYCPKFWVLLSGKNRENMATPSSWKQKIHCLLWANKTQRV